MKKEQLQFDGLPPKQKQKQDNAKKREWERGFQKWSDEQSKDERTPLGICGNSRICDYCSMNLSGDDPVKEAIAWKDRLRYELDLLLDEKSAIERRAVEEFAKKLKEKALSHCKIINCYELTFIEETINELLKEYENE